MKDFRLAMVAVIWADTPKSAIKKKRETYLENKTESKIKVTWKFFNILINLIETRHSQTSL